MLENHSYIEQPKGFMLTTNEGFVCKLKKDLYVLKEAPRAWYKRLDKYLQQQGFKKGTIDNNLYIKFEGDDILIVVVYVDDIIFGSDIKHLGHQFIKCMQTKFEISMIIKFSLLLGFQITKSP